MFTDPSVGRVGHDARSAREAGLEATVHRTELKDTARGREWGLESGYFELVAETATGRLLGGTFVGHEASELVQMLIPLVERGESVETIGESVFIHPTFGESIMMLARKFAG